MENLGQSRVQTTCSKKELPLVYTGLWCDIPGSVTAADKVYFQKKQIECVFSTENVF